MRIDAHFHLDERRQPLPALLSAMDRADIRRTVLIARVTEEVEPDKSRAMLAIQRTLLSSAWGRPAARLAAATFYDRTGSVRSCWRPFTAGGRGYRKSMEPDNDSVARAVAAHPNRLWGWAFVNPRLGDPRVGDALAQAERWLSVPGMIGVKAHPYWHGFGVRELEPLLLHLEAKRIPLLIHLGFGAQGDFAWLAGRFPRLPVVFAHAAIPFFGAAWRTVRSREGLYVDLSSCHLSAGLVRRAVAALGPDRCLFGTDGPYGFTAPDGGYDDSVVRGWVERLALPDAEMEAVWGGNLLRILEPQGARLSLS